jgi:hypothetical protein
VARKTQKCMTDEYEAGADADGERRMEAMLLDEHDRRVAPGLADRLERAAEAMGDTVRLPFDKRATEWIMDARPLAAMLREAAAALRAAEADTARLDWLGAQEYCEINRMGTTEAYWIVQCRGNAHAPTLRAAIDAARKEAGDG